MLKLASNFEIFNYFFVFCWIEKKEELVFNFYNEITQASLDLEDALKCIEKHNNENDFILNTNFNIQMT